MLKQQRRRMRRHAAGRDSGAAARSLRPPAASSALVAAAGTSRWRHLAALWRPWRRPQRLRSSSHTFCWPLALLSLTASLLPPSLPPSLPRSLARSHALSHAARRAVPALRRQPRGARDLAAGAPQPQRSASSSFAWRRSLVRRMPPAPPCATPPRAAPLTPALPPAPLPPLRSRSRRLVAGLRRGLGARRVAGRP
jgi:hypothetical protein